MNKSLASRGSSSHWVLLFLVVLFLFWFSGTDWSLNDDDASEWDYKHGASFPIEHLHGNPCDYPFEGVDGEKMCINTVANESGLMKANVPISNHAILNPSQQ